MKNEQKIYRVIDANFNRTREGLRVIEDTFRFVCNDRQNSDKIRSLRHCLTKVSRKIYPQLICSRDSVKDLGRGNREKKYSSIDNILLANIRRVEESLRVLEEYSRLISSSANRTFKKIRFEIYNIEKQLRGRC